MQNIFLYQSSDSSVLTGIVYWIAYLWSSERLFLHALGFVEEGLEILAELAIEFRAETLTTCFFSFLGNIVGVELLKSSS